MAGPSETPPNSSEAFPQVHIVIGGKVRRVGYRRFIRARALELGLAGWVKNEGKNVVALAQGPEPDLRQFLEELSAGPRLGKPTDVEATWSTTDQRLEGFRIQTRRWLRWLIR